MSAPEDCGVCDTLPADELLELDALLGDPARWPETVWGLFEKPKGGLTASYRRFGAVQMGRRWLTDHGYNVSDLSLKSHIRKHVVHVPRDAGDLVQLGIIATRDPHRRIRVPERIEPTAFIEYFNTGITVGKQALEMLVTHINEAVEAGKPPPMETVELLATLGARLASNQAVLRAKGLSMEIKDDERDAFMGTRPVRVGRVRILESDTIADDGPADRADYRQRAKEDGTEHPFGHEG